MQVKVWNDGDFTWREKFKNKEVVIEPKSFIWMNRDEAVDFEGRFVVPKLDQNRQPLPESMKRIRVEGAYGPHLYEKNKPKKYVCQADGKEFDTEEELRDYVQSHWRHALVDQEAADEAPQKRGRGRPPKNVSEGL